MKYNKFTYQKSGVNISQADKFVDFISKKTEKKTKKSKYRWFWFNHKYTKWL